MRKCNSGKTSGSVLSKTLKGNRWCREVISQPQQYAADAAQFLNEIAQAPYVTPSDRLAATKALGRVSKPSPAAPRARRQHVAIEIYYCDESGAVWAPRNTAQSDRVDPPAADSSEAREATPDDSMLLQYVDLMSDPSARMSARIAAAELVCTEASNVDGTEDTPAYVIFTKDDFAIL